MYNLAYSYETGKGVPRDPVRAFRLYSRAARLGDVDALAQQARCLFYGIGTTANRTRAKALYARATQPRPKR